MQLPDRKTLSVGLAVLVVAIISSCLITFAVTRHIDNNHQLSMANTGTSSLAVSANPVMNQGASKAPDPIKFSGAGQTATDKFDLTAGLATIKLTHDGTGNFAVRLLDADGNATRDGYFVNVIGAFNGSKALQVPSDGKYILDIQANGNWTVTIQQ